MTCPFPFVSTPNTRPRLLFRSPITSPSDSSGTATSTVMIGSKRPGFACRTPFLKASDPAILKAISEESTVWYDPSYTVTLTSTTGYPASTPSSLAPRLFLMPPLDLDPPLDRLLVRDAGRLHLDLKPEFPLEALDRDLQMGLPHPGKDDFLCLWIASNL